MKGYVANIEKLTLKNSNFRKVLYTDKRLQLVIMSLLPKEEIGMEVHDLDQFIRIEQGKGKSILNGKSRSLASGSAVIIPAGVKHNIVNTDARKMMKIYTLYVPPNHKHGTIHRTKARAEKDDEHFDGKISA